VLSVLDVFRGPHYISNTTEWHDYLFRKYPLLRILLDNYFSDLCGFVKSILTHFNSDFEALCNLCCVPELKLVRFELFIGDSHRKGMSVIKLYFKDGNCVFYKPRSSRNEITFKQVIQTINRSGFMIIADVPTLLDCETHSWVREIKQCDVMSHFDENAYYRNLGRLMCVLYVLGITDIIPDNIISSNGTPYLIDIECVHSKYPKDGTSSAFANKFIHSVSGVGMLPKWVLTSPNERGELVSVFYKFGSNHHLPCYKGLFYEINQKTSVDFTVGFKECYRFILKHKTLLNKFKTSFEHNSQRLIFHDTIIYSFLLREMCLPETLSSNTGLQSLIETIVPECFISFSKQLVHSIWEQLLHFDIPFFYIRNDNSLIDGCGKIITTDVVRTPVGEPQWYCGSSRPSVHYSPSV